MTIDERFHLITNDPITMMIIGVTVALLLLIGVSLVNK